jgi:pimeloyl-ACP methyl ester carboxylesterase
MAWPASIASSHRLSRHRAIWRRAPVTVDEMARDTIALIRAMGFSQVDLLGFSLGGSVAQDVALKAPDLVRRLILTGTGPAGGRGIDRVGAKSSPLMIEDIAAGDRYPTLDLEHHESAHL